MFFIQNLNDRSSQFDAIKAPGKLLQTISLSSNEAPGAFNLESNKAEIFVTGNEPSLRSRVALMSGRPLKSEILLHIMKVELMQTERITIPIFGIFPVNDTNIPHLARKFKFTAFDHKIKLFSIPEIETFGEY